MPNETKISIINSDPVAITSLLRNLGRKAFKERCTFKDQPLPKFDQIYLELDNTTCWVMVKGEYIANVLFSLKIEEIPPFGWQVFGKIERREKS